MGENGMSDNMFSTTPQAMEGGVDSLIGAATAYADAVAAGYTGTREQWAEDMAKLGENLAAVRTEREKAESAAQTAVDARDTAVQTINTTRDAAVESIEQAAAEKVGEINGIGAVRFDGAQELSAEQQTQARANIGAASADEVGKLSDEIAENSNKIVITGNLYNKDTVSVGKYITGSGYAGDNSNYNLTDYIPIDPSKGSLYIYCVLDDGYTVELRAARYIVFFDLVGSLITGLENTNNASIPQNATSVRITFNDSVFGVGKLYVTYSANESRPHYEKYTEGLKYGNAPVSIKRKTVPYIWRGNNKRVKFLGDSITAGAGGSGYNASGDLIATYGEKSWYVNVDGYCWANLLKSMMEDKYGCIVKNYGCSGITAYKLDLIMDQVVESDDDLVFVMVGTNDRSNTSTLLALKNALKRICAYLSSHNKEYILMSCIPASVENEALESETRYYHMDSVADVYSSLALELGVEYIDLYSEMLEYIRNSGNTIDDILSDGLHPNDEGYRIIYEIICKHLGLASKINGASW